MVKEINRTTTFDTFSNEPETPADFGRNEIVVYRGSRVGRMIVALMGGIVILNIVLCIVSVGMFTKSIKMNERAMAQSSQLITALEEAGTSAATTEGAKSSSKDTAPVSKVSSKPEATAQPVAEEATKSEETTEQTPANTSVKLSSLKMVSQQGVEISDQCQNTLGDTYSNAILGMHDTETWVTYYLDGKYSNLTADLSANENYWVNETPYVFEIYINNDENNVIYTTSLSRLSTVEHLDIDVSGAEFITIRARFNGYSQRPSFILSDAKLDV